MPRAFYGLSGRKPQSIHDETLTAAFQAHKEGSTEFTHRMAINMADFFGVCVRELVLRLEQIELLKTGAWEWFRRNGGFNASISKSCDPKGLWPVKEPNLTRETFAPFASQSAPHACASAKLRNAADARKSASMNYRNACKNGPT